MDETRFWGIFPVPPLLMTKVDMPRTRRAMVLIAGFAIFATAPAMAQVGRSLGVIDANVAQGSELLSVPGLTPEMVKAILETRPFPSMVEFDAFLGRNLDRDQRSILYQRIFLPINLNATSDAELRLVPGIGARMLQDFRETKPYESLATFHQEVSKYLAPKDVALLSQYVFVPVDVNTASDEDLRTIPGISPKLLKVIRKHRPYQNMGALTKAIRGAVSAKEAARLSAFFRTTIIP